MSVYLSVSISVYSLPVPLHHLPTEGDTNIPEPLPAILSDPDTWPWTLMEPKALVTGLGTTFVIRRDFIIRSKWRHL